jgi:hypothetical protein
VSSTLGALPVHALHLLQATTLQVAVGVLPNSVATVILEVIRLMMKRRRRRGSARSMNRALRIREPIHSER